jgi:hypothetical protein
MSASALATEPSDFRCAECGYGICVSGMLPPCPMCQTTSWEAERLYNQRSGDEPNDENA